MSGGKWSGVARLLLPVLVAAAETALKTEEKAPRRKISRGKAQGRQKKKDRSTRRADRPDKSKEPNSE